MARVSGLIEGPILGGIAWVWGTASEFLKGPVIEDLTVVNSGSTGLLEDSAKGSEREEISKGSGGILGPSSEQSSISFNMSEQIEVIFFLKVKAL